jgi:hypothetical protein
VIQRTGIYTKHLRNYWERKGRLFLSKWIEKVIYCDFYGLCILGLCPLVVALALPALAKGFHLHCLSVDDLLQFESQDVR